MGQKKFNSKIDSIIILPFLILIAVDVLMMANGIWTAVVFVSLAILFVIYAVSSTHYTITDDNKLIVKAAFFINRKIEISNIRKITATRILIASPAASLDRLLISYNKYDTIIISPKNKKEFIEELQRINAAIIIEGITGSVE